MATKGGQPNRGVDKQNIAQLNADLASNVMRNYKQQMRAAGPKMVMPGGRVVPVSQAITGRFKTPRHGSALSIDGQNAEKYLTPEWMADHPGWEYAWVQVSDTPSKHPQAAIAQSRLSSGEYVPVPKDAFRKDSGIPFSTHTTPTGDKVCQVFDVALVAMSPEVWGNNFRVKEEMANRAIAGNWENFYDAVENTDPGPGAIGARGELEVKLSRT